MLILHLPDRLIPRPRGRRPGYKARSLTAFWLLLSKKVSLNHRLFQTTYVFWYSSINEVPNIASVGDSEIKLLIILLLISEFTGGHR